MFDLSLHLHPHFACASSESSGESAPEHSLLDNAISNKMTFAGSFSDFFTIC